MSAKTKKATDEIEVLIEDVTHALLEVSNVINQMIDEISLQKEAAQKTSDSFDSIHENSLTIQKHVDSLLSNVKALTDANQGIMDSIQTISQSSQQVSALSNSAMESENLSSKILETIHSKMQELVKRNNKL